MRSHRGDVLPTRVKPLDHDRADNPGVSAYCKNAAGLEAGCVSGRLVDHNGLFFVCRFYRSHIHGHLDFFGSHILLNRDLSALLIGAVIFLFEGESFFFKCSGFVLEFFYFAQ